MRILRHGRRQGSGFTLIEMLVVVAIIGILAALAAPSMTRLLERGRLRGAAEQVASDLQLARTEAIKRNQDVKVTFSSDTPSTSWCYGVRVGGDCNCAITDPTDATACQIDGVLKVTSSADFAGVSLAGSFVGSGVNARTTGFNPRHGTAQTGVAGAPENGTVTATIKSDNLSVRVTLLGRVRVCSTNGMPGFQSCT